ncbi:MAG: toll/interleukin-1 receptor domain-containing protein [Lachnospiraceae bacterium]|nr:toll/interleukin-1 receptor domain-containing protein [Lachnospiraceae bacterium]
MDRDFIFISYSHKDSDRILPLISRLENDGIHVWYDEGIDPGTEWDENIASHLKGCSGIIAFLSGNYLASDNCRDELNYARDLGRERLLVYLEDVELPAGMAMRLNRLQAIHKYRYKNKEDFYAELINAPMLMDFKASSSATLSSGQPSAVNSDAVAVPYASIPYASGGGDRPAADGLVSKREFLKQPEHHALGSIVMIMTFAVIAFALFLLVFGDYFGCPVIIILTAIGYWKLNYFFILPCAVISLVFGFMMINLHFILLALLVILFLGLFRADIEYNKYRYEIKRS